MARNAARITLTAEALGSALNLKDGIRVICAIPQDAADVLHGTIQILVEGSELPECCEGASAPLVDLECLQEPQKPL